jgi:hypothetical protein
MSLIGICRISSLAKSGNGFGVIFCLQEDNLLPIFHQERRI